MKAKIIAEEILALINAQPRTPTLEEIKAAVEKADREVGEFLQIVDDALKNPPKVVAATNEFDYEGEPPLKVCVQEKLPATVSVGHRLYDVRDVLGKPEDDTDAPAPIQWYRDAMGDDFKHAPPCVKATDGKHEMSLTGTWCTLCGLRGRIAA